METQITCLTQQTSSGMRVGLSTVHIPAYTDLYLYIYDQNYCEFSLLSPLPYRLLGHQARKVRFNPPTLSHGYSQLCPRLSLSTLH